MDVTSTTSFFRNNFLLLFLFKNKCLKAITIVDLLQVLNFRFFVTIFGYFLID